MERGLTRLPPFLPLSARVQLEGAERRTRIHVVDLNTGATVHELETDPVFSFHHINAYRAEADRVVVNLVAFENSDVIRQFWGACASRAP